MLRWRPLSFTFTLYVMYISISNVHMWYTLVRLNIDATCQGTSLEARPRLTLSAFFCLRRGDWWCSSCVGEGRRCVT